MQVEIHGKGGLGRICTDPEAAEADLQKKACDSVVPGTFGDMDCSTPELQDALNQENMAGVQVQHVTI